MWKRFIEWLDWADRTSFVWSLVPAILKAKAAIMFAALTGSLTSGIVAGLVAAAIVWVVLSIPSIFRRIKQVRGHRIEPISPDIFDRFAQLVHSEITRVHFSQLWNDDPYLVFEVQIQNYLPYDIELEGVKGNANIDNTPCTRDAKSPQKFQAKRYAYPSTWATFYQPITEAMAKTLQTKMQDAQAIPFSLSGVEWIGNIVLPKGVTRQFPIRLPCASEFDVDSSHQISKEYPTAQARSNWLLGGGPDVKKP
jgi:hypothetical protein